MISQISDRESCWFGRTYPFRQVFFPLDENFVFVEENLTSVIKNAAMTDEVEEHPIVEYVHVQCQSCGRRVPDAFPAEEVEERQVFLGVEIQLGTASIFQGHVVYIYVYVKTINVHCLLYMCVEMLHLSSTTAGFEVEQAAQINQK